MRSKKYFGLPRLDPQDHLDDLNEIRGFMESLGVSTKNTRIDRYIDYYRKNLRKINTEASSIFKNAKDKRFRHWIDWHLYILREVHELMWILKGLKVSLPNNIEDKLMTVVSGADFAALDTNSHSRNTQFELRIASYFCQAGCRVDFSSTDIVVTTNDCIYYIECKRVGSVRQLEKSAKDAKKQLAKRMPLNVEGKKVYGVIAIDVTKVAYPHNGLTWAIYDGHARRLIQRKLNGISLIVDDFDLFSGKLELIQCWMQIHIPSLLLFPRIPTTRFSSFTLINPSLSSESELANRLFMEMSYSASKES